MGDRRLRYSASLSDRVCIRRTSGRDGIVSVRVESPDPREWVDCWHVTIRVEIEDAEIVASGHGADEARATSEALDRLRVVCPAAWILYGAICGDEGGTV